MDIALVGTGQMGEAVAGVAPERGHEVVARFDSTRPLTAASPDNLRGADVAIDFSLPDVALPHLRRYCRWQQPAVVGTTGWYDHLDDVAALVEEHDARVLYAPNFSIGVAVTKRALTAVAPLIDALEDYDAFVHEMHHTNKVDSPSGTAEMLAQVLVDGLERKSTVETETQHDRIDPEALHVTSTRAGSVFGEHTVGFDGSYDRIELSHTAKSRTGFAFGAVRAAEWLVENDGRRGLFTLDDVLDDWLS
jgi:4-hydroxy-tetrahydrodipicolinate reductase